jgi:hypothetical protein
VQQNDPLPDILNEQVADAIVAEIIEKQKQKKAENNVANNQHGTGIPGFHRWNQNNSRPLDSATHN